MEDLEYEKRKLEDVEKELDEIKDGEEEILKTLPKRYKSDPHLLSNLMSISATKISNIARMKEKPYFARIDFKENNKNSKDKLYIAKIGELYIDGNVVIT